MVLSFVDIFVNQMLLPWLNLFAAPFKDFDMLWITIPVILAWAFTELYQEKKGTSYGNAITNGVVMLWVGIDWMRQVFLRFNENNVGYTALFFTTIGISLAVLIYGFFIIFKGMHAKNVARIWGRIRQITYICLVFTPIVYGAVQPTWYLLLAIVVFYPIFHFLVELTDWVVPDPKTYAEEEAEKSNKFDTKGLNDNFSLDILNNQPLAQQYAPPLNQTYPPYQQPRQQRPLQKTPYQYTPPSQMPPHGRF